MKKIKKKVRMSTVCISGEFCTKRTPVLIAPIRRSAGRTALWGAGCQRESTTTTYRKAMAFRRNTAAGPDTAIMRPANAGPTARARL